MSTNDVGNISSENIYGVYTPAEEARNLKQELHQIQLEMAAAAKKGIPARMDEIRASQEEQKYVAGLLNEARQLQADAKRGKGDVEGDPEASYMPQYMKDYMDANGLAYDNYGNDLKNNADEWEVAITSLQSHLEQLGMDTQQDMVFIQDVMGQYDAHLNGAKDILR